VKIALLDIKGDDNRKIDKSSAVNIRNMIEISKALEADFYYNTKMLSNKEYDIIIFGFGSIASEINKTSDFVLNSKVKKIYWLVGEYEQSMNPSLYYSCKKTNKNFETIQNFDIEYKSFGKLNINKHFLNLNLLIAKKANDLIAKKYECVYYSRWRPNRAKYLKEYLKEDIYFSSDAKNFKQHKHIGCNPKWIKKLSWENKKETLSLFKYSLYLEDEKTHNVFNNLANRYYEAGFCNNVVFFDVNCRNTIDKSELSYYKEQVEDYIVESYEDLQSKIKECNKDFDKHLAIQKGWRMNEATARADMLEELKNIIYNGTK
jgi:hypothetical protein|tara:strand:- start:209 stop:1162 length:954 start_codon:yes stop_codon:yes gene_type:complete